MSKIINVLNQVKQLRTDSYAISMGDAQITIYEPVDKFRETRPGSNGLEPKNTSVATDPLKILMALTIVLTIFVVLHSYVMSAKTQKQIITMNQAFEDLRQEQSALRTGLQALKEDMKDSSINTAFEINSLNNRINQLQEDAQTKQQNIMNSFNSVTAQLQELRSLIQQTPGRE